MCKFVNLIVDKNNLLSQNTQYLSNVIFLYLRYEKFLNDDYAAKVNYENILNLIENCRDLFFVFLNEEDDDFAGFVYLDNLTGNNDKIHGGEITVCFEKKYWGKFTRQAAREFFNYCFNTLGFTKIKAQIYPFNSRVKNILTYSGFKKDGVLRGETMKNGKITDVEVYSLLKSDFSEKFYER